jgi:predicted RNA methylase
VRGEVGDPHAGGDEVRVAIGTSVHCTLYHREPGFAALAEAELRALGGGSSAEPGVWLSPAPIRWAACGYGSAGGRQLAFAATLEELEEQLRELKLVAPRFSLAVRRLPRQHPGALEAKRRIADCIDGAVSMADPELRLLLVVSALGLRLLVDQPASPGEAGWLDASRKPHNYVVAAPVRLAKAMLNLTVQPGDTVLDPFCGTGTIPLLAAMAGHRSFGSDISAACVERAAENLAHFGYQATFACVDARETEQRADCVVSNLPYGLYAHTAAGALPAIFENLRRLAPRQTFVTSERIENDLRGAGYSIDQVLSVEAERFERLVYLTRAA